MAGDRGDGFVVCPGVSQFGRDRMA